jgi:MFS family permease
MRRLLILVGAIVFVDTMFFAALTPLLPHYVHDLGLSKAQAGLLSAAYPIGTFVGALPGGIATARLGVKPAALIGLAGLIATTIMFGFAHSEWALDLARFAQGVASAFTWAAGLTWLTLMAPADRRGELIGSALAAAIGGALFGPVVGGVASVVGTAAAFSGIAVLAAGIAIGVATTPAPGPQRRQPISALWYALGDPRLRTAMWFVVLPGILFGLLGVLGPLRLSELGLGALGIGATWFIATGLEAIASPYVGRVSDRRGRIAPILVGLVASAIALGLLPWPDRWFVLAALVLCAAVSFGLFWAPAMSLLADTSEARGLDYAYGFALMNMAWAPGQFSGAALGGALAGATGGDAVPYLCAGALCVLTLLFLRRHHSLLSLNPA